VAKLLIFRGDTQLDERELTGKTVRIGRGSQNDIVLEDPGKGVSRNHAEIRFEGGRYTLIDLGSQNGLWVSGTRVPSVVLDPDVSVAVGPYRLKMEAPVAITPAGGVVPISNIDTGPIEPTQFSVAVALNLDSVASAPAPVGQKPAPAMEEGRGPAVKEPTRQERSASKSTSHQVTVTRERAPSSTNVRILIQITSLLVVVVLGGVAYKVFQKAAAPPAWDASVAQSLIASGKCQEALDTQITPALQKNPNNQQATALRDECNRTLAQVTSIATSSIPATPTADDKLNEAEPMLQANVAAECQKGLDIITAVMAEDAANQRAKDMAVRANACITPPAPARGTLPQPTTEKPAVAISPAQGGLEINPGETDKQYKARVQAAGKKYDDALALLTDKKYQQALNALLEIQNEVPSGYRDLQQRRDEARQGIRGEAKTALTAAEAAESRGDLDTAWEQVRRARQIDPNTQGVEPAYQRKASRRAELGKERCAAGNIAKIYGQTATAVAAFQDAVKLLQGTNDPCLPVAREYLQKMGK